MYDLVSFTLPTGLIYFAIWSHLLHDLVSFTLTTDFIYFAIWYHFVLRSGLIYFTI
jgi:hypothetical protein